MAIQFVDSVDHYTASTDIVRKWTNGVSIMAVLPGGGRFGTAALISGIAEVTLATPATEWCWSFLFRASANASNRIASVNISGTAQVRLMRLSNGALDVQRLVTSIGTTIPGLIVPTAFHVIRWQGTIHNTTGTVRLWVDGTEVLTLSGVDTQAHSTLNTWDTAFVDASVNQRVEDLIVCTDPADLVALDHHVACLFPTADGAHTAWSKTAGSDAYALVDEPAPDTSDAIFTAAVGAKQSLTFPAPPAGTIPGLQLCAYLRVDTTAAPRLVRAGFRAGGVDYPHPTVVTLGISDIYYRWIWQVNPATSGPFVTADFPAEFYLECVA